MKIADAIKLYERYTKYEIKPVTQARYRNDLRLLCLCLKNCDIERITKEDILEQMDMMTELGWKKVSLFQKLSAFRIFFKFLRKHGYHSLDPEHIPKVKLEFVEPRVATDIEYKKILSVIPKRGMFNIRNNAMIRLLWDTGVRNGELVAFNIKDLPKKDVDGVYSMTIRTEKSRGKRPFREVFWTKETHDALLHWIEVRNEYAERYPLEDPDAVFVSLNRGEGRRLTIQSPGEILTKYSKMAKLPTVNPHSFRHAKARKIIERGGSNSDVMNILGHSSLASSEIYTTLYGKRFADRAQKFL